MEFTYVTSPTLALLVLALLSLGLGAFFISPTARQGVAASEPTPVPPPFPPKIPIDRVSREDTQKLHDRLPVQSLLALTDKPCVNGKAADTYPCSNVDLLAFLPLDQIGGGYASSSWGWTDPDTHHEYALLGRSNGTSFVDLTNPRAPIYVGNLPTATGESSWRELKTYGYYALVVSDRTGPHGMQIFDLRQLRDVTNPHPPPCPNTPASADLVSPAPGANIPNLRAPLVWNTNACATEFKVVVREQTANGEMVRQRANLNATRFKTQTLERSKMYRWTVRACNAWGCSKGSTRSFTIH